MRPTTVLGSLVNRVGTSSTPRASGDGFGLLIQGPARYAEQGFETRFSLNGQLRNPLPHHLRDVHAGRGVVGPVGDVDQDLGDEVHCAVALGGSPGVVHQLHGVLALLGEGLVPTHALGGLGLRRASGCAGWRTRTVGWKGRVSGRRISWCQ